MTIYFITIHQGHGGSASGQRSDCMSISINWGSKNQNSLYLLQSMTTSSGNSLGNLSFLSDYASIKNGSYGKLMKAYYAKDSSSEVSSLAESKYKKTTSTAKDSAKTLAAIETAADGLKESADALITTGSKSVFKKVDVESTDEYGFTSTTKEYDTDAIYKSVSGFVEDYNNLLKQTGSSETNSIQNRVKMLNGITSANKNLLSKVGITINSDNTLSLDEKAFKEADMTTVKSLFNGNSSYGYRVSAQASLIDYAAEQEASRANTYTVSGSYGNIYSSGSIFDYGF